MGELEFPASDAMARYLDGIVEQGPESEDHPIATGLWELDDLLAGGLRTGSVSLVAGVPGVGTSMFCLGVVLRAALVAGLPTLVIAPDTDEKEAFARLVSAEATIPINHLRSGTITSDDVAKVARKQVALSAAPLEVSANWPKPATAGALLGTVEQWLQYGVQLVFIDGTHLAEPQTRDLVRGLTSIARPKGPAILVATKVVMPDERRTDWPRMEDLREYHSAAELVDLILGIHRPDMHDPQSTRPGEADIDILKHRYGPTRRLTVAFQGHYARFLALAH